MLSSLLRCKPNCFYGNNKAWYICLLCGAFGVELVCKTAHVVVFNPSVLAVSICETFQLLLKGFSLIISFPQRSSLAWLTTTRVDSRLNKPHSLTAYVQCDYFLYVTFFPHRCWFLCLRPVRQSQHLWKLDISILWYFDDIGSYCL